VLLAVEIIIIGMDDDYKPVLFTGIANGNNYVL
jgi:hypothetical protein